MINKPVKELVWPDDFINQIICGDCLEVMKKIPDGAVDLVLTDPPYGTTACKWDSIIPLDLLWKSLLRITKTEAAFLFFASQPFTTTLITGNMKMFKYTWVWDKVQGANFFNLKNRPLKTHEDIVVFSEKSNFTFNPIRVLRTLKSLQRYPIGKAGIVSTIRHKIEHYNAYKDAPTILKKDGTKHPIDILRYSTFADKRNNYKHPAKKPLDLLKYLVTTYSNESDLILDFTIGSGTTAVAAKQLGRKYIGIEINPEYCKMAEERLKQEELFNTEV